MRRSSVLLPCRQQVLPYGLRAIFIGVVLATSRWYEMHYAGLHVPDYLTYSISWKGRVDRPGPLSLMKRP